MTDDLKPYPAYKDSGVPWLGKVPESWQAERLKTRVKNIVQQTAEFSHDELHVALEHVESWTGRLRDGVPDATFDSQVKSFRANDVLFGKLRPYLAKVVRPNRDGVCVGEFFVLRPRDLKVSAPYLEHLLRSKPIIDAINSSTFGAKMPRADWQFVGSMRLSFPSLLDQSAIVRFLEDAERRIRRFVRVKQKLIKLLEEQKQAIINQAVTRGLNPNVRLKASGVEWLGEVPEHWEILRGKYVGRLFSTPSVSDDDLTENSDSHLMYLKVSDLARTNAAFRLTQSKLYVKSTKVDAQRPNRPCVVFPKRGGAIYTNKVAIVETNCLLDPNLMGWDISDRFDPLYVALLLKTRTLADLADVSSVPQLNNKHINPISFPAPSRPEQEAILAQLDLDLAGINTAISRTQNELSLVREYRTRLIADVVTGKLDVRDTAAGLPDETSQEETILDDAEPLFEDDVEDSDSDLETALEEVEA